MLGKGGSTRQVGSSSGESMKHEVCVVIPLYKQLDAIESTLKAVQSHDLPCLLIDDGNEPSVREVLTELVERFPKTRLHSLATNQGKGGAVMAGLRLAYGEGYTHALQVDADGQHDLTQIPVFLQLSQVNPSSLVAGQPVFDASVNRMRWFFRQLTHFLVKVQTLQWTAPDTMCGYRIYPLGPTCALLDRIPVGRRMDFDIEIMVRLIWDGVPVVKHYTTVIYPEGGQSNFDYFHDNVLITIFILHSSCSYSIIPACIVYV